MLIEVNMSGSGLGHVLTKTLKIATIILSKGHSVYLNMPKETNQKYGKDSNSENLFDLFIEQEFSKSDCEQICLGRNKHFLRNLETIKETTREEALGTLHLLLQKTTPEVQNALNCWSELPRFYGIHIRRGDAGRDRAPIFPCSIYRDLIDQYLQEEQPFYLATDSSVVAEKLQSFYQDRIHLGNFVRRCDGKGLHQSNSTRSRRASIEAYVDFLALSLTSRLICTSSRLSRAAQFFHTFPAKNFFFDEIGEPFNLFLKEIFKKLDLGEYENSGPLWQRLQRVEKACAPRGSREQKLEELWTTWLRERL